VPHEKPELAAHGGSYFEETDWWTKKRKRNVAGELRFIIPEIVLLRGLRDFNRKLWCRSFPFHAGLYLLITAAVLSVANAWIEPWVAFSMVGAVARAAAWFGLGLTLLGATALFCRRISDPELRNYTTLGDLFNVGAFATAAALVIAGRFSGSMPSVHALARALLTFDTSLHIPALAGCGLVMGAFMAGYVPFTHMGHFVAKYFTYHAVRWDDAPNAADRKMVARIAEQLTYRPTWSAAHVGADGKRTWAEIATTNPAKEDEMRK
jgi:nitrate reductase gamma subunit